MKTLRFALLPVVALAILFMAVLVLRRPQLGRLREWPGLLVARSAALFGRTGQADDLVLASVPFELVVVDEHNAGDIKLVGDLDGDGFADLVVGGMPAEGLHWYRFPAWEKSAIATPQVEFTTDGALGDVDGDGDLDIVVPDGNEGDNLLWFENPGPQADAAGPWTRQVIGAIGSWGKDVELADFDGDTRLDVAVRSESRALLFFQLSPGVWQETILSAAELGFEGMASGDIDGDGDVDLVLRGIWLQNPGNAAARAGEEWHSFAIGPAPENFKALVVDLNQDGHQDVLFSSSEDTAAVEWWTPATGDPSGTWQRQTIMAEVEKAHTLQAADMDLDGDIDVVIGQMHTAAVGELALLRNLDGQGITWQREVIGEGGLHNGVLADIGNDGDLDIFGANWTGNPPVRLWRNRLDESGPLDRWTYKQVTVAHEQSFGLAFGDVNQDGRPDIVSGSRWYANPGGEMLGEWVQGRFPEGMQAFLVLDVDGDEQGDVIAQKDEGEIALYWLEAVDQTAGTWNVVGLGRVPQASHALGAQGYGTATLQHGERASILISSGNGIYAFTIPANPQTDAWPRIHISANPSDEGLAAGDVDGDGLTDVVATTGTSKRVEWYRNPGTSGGTWTAYHLGTFTDAVYPDRVGLADLNGDGRPDVIVSEENGSESEAATYWWEQPADPTSGNWPAHLITSQATTHSLETADVDSDGDNDVLLAEHRGEKKLTIWINDGQGQLTPHTIDAGKESHLGAQTADLDQDGDLDIVSIAWDAYQFIHLWRNDSVKTGTAECSREK